MQPLEDSVRHLQEISLSMKLPRVTPIHTIGNRVLDDLAYPEIIFSQYFLQDEPFLRFTARYRHHSVIEKSFTQEITQLLHLDDLYFHGFLPFSVIALGEGVVDISKKELYVKEKCKGSFNQEHAEALQQKETSWRIITKYN